MKLLTFILLFIYATLSFAQENPPIEALGQNEGYAIIAIYSKGYAEKIVLEGAGFGNTHTFGPLDYEQHFSVVKLKAGTYHWEKVHRKIGQSLTQTTRFDELDLSFNVEAGKLNYTGLLMFETDNNQSSAKILNRTSIILSITKQDFPQYLKQFSVVNGIYPNDQYIGFFLNKSKPVQQGE